MKHTLIASLVFLAASAPAQPNPAGPEAHAIARANAALANRHLVTYAKLCLATPSCRLTVREEAALRRLVALREKESPLEFRTPAEVDFQEAFSKTEPRPGGPIVFNTQLLAVANHDGESVDGAGQRARADRDRELAPLSITALTAELIARYGTQYGLGDLSAAGVKVERVVNEHSEVVRGFGQRITAVHLGPDASFTQLFFAVDGQVHDLTTAVAHAQGAQCKQGKPVGTYLWSLNWPHAFDGRGDPVRARLNLFCADDSGKVHGEFGDDLVLEMRGPEKITAFRVGCSSDTECSPLATLPKPRPKAEPALFVSSCRVEGKQLECRLGTLTQGPPSFHYTAFPKVIPARPAEIGGEIVELSGSTVDPVRRLAFWHTGCNGEYFVTELASGVTRRFPIPQGLCLAELAYDPTRAEVIALGGHLTPTGHSAAESALVLGANGEVSQRFDLRGKVTGDWRFLHPYQSIVSFDSLRGEMVAPLYSPTQPARTQRLALNVRTGAVRFFPGGGGVQHQFYEPTRDRHLYFSCDLPGITDLVRTVVPFPPAALKRVGIEEICYRGFVGAGYDPRGGKQYMLLRQDRIDPRASFQVGVANVITGKWEGALPTDVTYEALGVGGLDKETFFMSVDYVP
jgi:hypothetical protein